MNINELAFSCNEKGWESVLHDYQNISIRFHCNETMSISFLDDNQRCIVQIPRMWISSLQTQFSFTTMNDGRILWNCNALDKLLCYVEAADQLQYESLPHEKNGVSYRKECVYKSTWLKKKQQLLTVTSTERLEFITGRNGQQLLRDFLLAKYKVCMITHISEPDLLVASHIKPWSECDNTPSERLNENNVLLLSVALDKLFDLHYISFDSQTGKMLVSPLITEDTLAKLGVYPQTMPLTILNAEQSRFLQYHNAHLRK